MPASPMEGSTLAAHVVVGGRIDASMNGRYDFTIVYIFQFSCTQWDRGSLPYSTNRIRRI